MEEWLVNKLANANTLKGECDTSSTRSYYQGVVDAYAKALEEFRSWRWEEDCNAKEQAEIDSMDNGCDATESDIN